MTNHKTKRRKKQKSWKMIWEMWASRERSFRMERLTRTSTGRWLWSDDTQRRNFNTAPTLLPSVSFPMCSSYIYCTGQMCIGKKEEDGCCSCPPLFFSPTTLKINLIFLSITGINAALLSIARPPPIATASWNYISGRKSSVWEIFLCNLSENGRHTIF